MFLSLFLIQYPSLYYPKSKVCLRGLHSLYNIWPPPAFRPSIQIRKTRKKENISSPLTVSTCSQTISSLSVRWGSYRHVPPAFPPRAADLRKGGRRQQLRPRSLHRWKGTHWLCSRQDPQTGMKTLLMRGQALVMLSGVPRTLSAVDLEYGKPQFQITENKNPQEMFLILIRKYYSFTKHYSFWIVLDMTLINPTY